ncbi:hypothetical protein A2U01_0064137, partial [Trifolium medium]|nr:hypothetical protein [Trifolium medium]
MPIVPMSTVTIWLDIATVEQGHVASGQHAIWSCSMPMWTVLDAYVDCARRC